MTFALYAVHDSYDIVKRCGFGQVDISISKQSDFVSFSFDYSVYQMVTVDVTNEGYSAFLDFLILPWTECHFVPEVYYERVHAVSLNCDGYGFTFRNQSSDSFHHYGFIYGNCF